MRIKDGSPILSGNGTWKTPSSTSKFVIFLSLAKLAKFCNFINPCETSREDFSVGVIYIQVTGNNQ